MDEGRRDFRPAFSDETGLSTLTGSSYRLIDMVKSC
ncbi:hypothetical protein RLEG3_23965 [Rhizobium leguminosarum bv. trifolii WSM1689]|nr:hypothetical protein RLEG3_23965 [Rhizobium leguminosarum bv. trifolii WSM1689]